MTETSTTSPVPDQLGVGAGSKGRGPLEDLRCDSSRRTTGDPVSYRLGLGCRRVTESNRRVHDGPFRRRPPLQTRTGRKDRAGPTFRLRDPEQKSQGHKREYRTFTSSRSTSSLSDKRVPLRPVEHMRRVVATHYQSRPGLLYLNQRGPRGGRSSRYLTYLIRTLTSFGYWEGMCPYNERKIRTVRLTSPPRIL